MLPLEEPIIPLVFLAVGGALALLALLMCRRSRRAGEEASRYRVIADPTDDWEYHEGADGRLLYVSPTCERLTGYPPERFLEDPELLRSIVHPDDRPAFDSHRAEVLAVAASQDRDEALRGCLEFRILTREGQTRWIGHRCTAIGGMGEPAAGHRASNRDISADKAVQQDLQRTARLLESVRAAQALYLSEAAPAQVFKTLLDALVTLTESQLGFLDEVGIDDRGAAVRLSLALSDVSWEKVSQQIFEELVTRDQEHRQPHETPAVRRHPVISNDPAHVPRSGRLAPALPSLLGYLGMPIFYGPELVGVAGIVNRPGGYDEALAVWLEPFLGTCAAIIHAQRLERRRQEAEAALRRASRYNRGLLEAALDPLVVIDRQGHISDVNLATEAATGHPRSELVGTDFASYFSDPAQAQAGYRRAFEHGVVRDYALELRHRDGRSTPVLYNAAVCRSPDGAIEQVFAAARDVSRVKRMTDMLRARLRLLDQSEGRSLEEILRASVDEAATLTESLIGFYHFLEPDQETLILQTWSTRTIEEFCQAEGAGLHYPLSEAGVWADCVRERRAIIHNDYSELAHRRGLPPGHAQILRQLVVPVFRGERIVAILGVGNKASDYVAADLEVVSTFADLAWDIVERKRAQSALSDLAYFDGLTGLPNRLLLADRLPLGMANARRYGGSMAVCYLDLDGFKRVNDRYGHAAGDHLLVILAERLRGAVREGDTVARLGGDEFVLLLGGLYSLEQAEQTLARVQAAIAVPVEIEPDTLVEVSASIGLTLHPADPSDADALIRHADQAMYAAKQAGRNCVRRFQALTDGRVT